jgi:hypothetical protein
VEPNDLYSLPLEEFTAARNALARQRPEAKGLRKPTVAAWAVNQLARRHGRELDAFLEAAGRLRAAQLGGEAEDVQRATQEERRALARLLQLAGEYAGAAQIDRVRQTLQAAAIDEAAAEQVRAGRLERELEGAGFGSLLLATPTTRPNREAERAKRIAQAQAELDEAEQALGEAEENAQAARHRYEQARGAVEEARRRADEAARRLREARGR